MSWSIFGTSAAKKSPSASARPARKRTATLAIHRLRRRKDRELALLEQRIAELERTLAEVEIVEDSGDHSEVSLGAHVIIQDSEGEREEYVIVDHFEADPRGRLSQTSPVGKVLMGKRTGDEVIAETPAGERRLRIVEIR